MGGIENMCRLTWHLNRVLELYKNYSDGTINIPEVQKCLSRLEELLSNSENWKEEVEEAKSWGFDEI